jgi:hypothetical protein
MIPFPYQNQNLVVSPHIQWTHKGRIDAHQSMVDSLDVKGGNVGVGRWQPALGDFNFQGGKQRRVPWDRNISHGSGGSCESHEELIYNE